MTRSPMLAWWNLCTSGWTASVQAIETLIAAQAVITSRVGTMQAAARDPLSGDYAELTRMVVEKAEAFGQAAASIARDVHPAQVQAIGLLADVSSPARLSERAVLLARHNAGVAGRALAPVHRRATANARRLKKKT